MNPWTLIVDIAKCHDCNNCYLACKDEFFENDFPPYSAAQPRHGQRWIDLLRKERGQYPRVDVSYLPLPCMQCDHASCVQAASNGAVYKREDGIVLIDPVKARGQKAIVDACPYHVIWWNQELQLPQKCTLCAHLLDEGWPAPRCVQACPTGALQLVRLSDAAVRQMALEQHLEVFHPEYGQEPRVFYKNLHRYTRCFVAGNLALKEPDECAAGATVTLKNDKGRVVATAVANNYGDFRIDGLEPQSGHYHLEAEYRGRPKQIVDLQLGDSLDLKTIFL